MKLPGELHVANRTNTHRNAAGEGEEARAGDEGRRRRVDGDAESPATPGAEAEREGEADKKEVRAGSRGGTLERAKRWTAFHVAQTILEGKID